MHPAIETDAQESQSVPLPLTVGSSRYNDANDDVTPEDNVIDGVNSSPIKLKRRSVPKIKSKLEKRSRRGHYANYGPALRCQIAKYALDHSNQDTINHFREKIDIEGKVNFS